MYTDGETVSLQRRYRNYDTTDLSGRFELSGYVKSGDISLATEIEASGYQNF